jgi:hypothetical protein
MDFDSRSIFLKTLCTALLHPANRCVVFTLAHHRRNSLANFFWEDATMSHSGWTGMQFFNFFLRVTLAKTPKNWKF